MCVGHNPEISYLAEYLTEAEIGVMQPAGMAAIKLKIDSWKNLEKGIGEMMQYVSPEMLDSA
jgi:phosphohistidine phosphatase